MCSIDNEKSSIAERFVITLKNRIYKHMTTIVENVDIVKLDYIAINKRQIKIGDHVRISKYKNIVTKFMFVTGLKNHVQ